jgi:hypothetical protein
MIKQCFLKLLPIFFVLVVNGAHGEVTVDYHIAG